LAGPFDQAGALLVVISTHFLSNGIPVTICHFASGLSLAGSVSSTQSWSLFDNIYRFLDTAGVSFTWPLRRCSGVVADAQAGLFGQAGSQRQSLRQDASAAAMRAVELHL
jgi:hypothetical protein